MLIKSSNLSSGVHSDIDLGFTSQLADGGRYEVSIDAFDKAGNKAIASAISDVMKAIIHSSNPKMPSPKNIYESRILKPCPRRRATTSGAAWGSRAAPRGPARSGKGHRISHHSGLGKWPTGWGRARNAPRPRRHRDGG